MVDAMIGDGDIVVMQQRHKADNGDLVACGSRIARKRR